jgi:hypothetical protein
MLSRNVPDKTRVVSNSEQGSVHSSFAPGKIMTIKVTLGLQMLLYTFHSQQLSSGFTAGGLSSSARLH